ncbi:hypothetical protein BCV72DRAFT_336634 [Rhizopus microsporus var. microsporus]|uniref:MULE transposase domain-containing protein n=2 Tax=Rhizopus microsporus TaxID=58291 RepID=A0A2G4SIU3_RHIZD|nr:uncharacterized protein RHIMIDRAFT_295015 [Rhizopus microsporus ATCC 52813]ORE05383.1 hypothetical protein BCV72DRAFT_336634 [Rhizopus microsporus var. microsporus]PHZ08698.1 hypothetical protein RHIMIDRAFT_295015 [Rhizopus microsporus ATCC 52813]
MNIQSLYGNEKGSVMDEYGRPESMDYIADKEQFSSSNIEFSYCLNVVSSAASCEYRIQPKVVKTKIRYHFQLGHNPQQALNYLQSEKFDNITKKVLRTCIITSTPLKKETILKAKRMPESLIIDATYKSNAHKQAFINIVGASSVVSRNLDSLATLEIVGAWVIEEQTYNYAWALNCLKETVWPASLDQQTPLPSVLQQTVEIQQKSACHHATTDHERATRFHEAYIIDVAYGTNSLKMPLICVYGVSSLGRQTLKTFPITFAWVANEREEAYSWSLKTLDNVLGEVPKETIVIPTAKLCRIFEKWKQNKDLFVNEVERIKLKNYYEIEWKLHLEKWAAIYTSKLQRMRCTTTQRADSDHSALKKGMFAVQPLQMSFEEINDYIEKLGRGFNDLQQKEKSKQSGWTACTNEFFAS